MSKDLIKARKLLTQVGTQLKQGKFLSAAQAIGDAITLELKTGVTKSERAEFSELLDNAVYALNNNAKFREVYPLIISYTPGDEKELLHKIHEVLKNLQENVNEAVQTEAAAIQRRKDEGLQQGQDHLDKSEHDEARTVFNGLVNVFQEDTDLKAAVADKYINSGLYEDAHALLNQALEHDPQAIFLYNHIGIALRRMGKFEQAEQYYLKALEISQSDEYLYFNCGRLYYDWEKWDKMLELANKALEINPDFTEALKMKNFALKKL